MKLNLSYDNCGIGPEDINENWKIISFLSRHINSEDPWKYATVTDCGYITASDIGIRRKLECQTAFWLDYYEHGLCEWSLRGEGPQCRWDTSHVAGILIYTGNSKDLPKDKRVGCARSYLEKYSNWCNGEVYGYYLENDEGEIIDSCGGFIGSEWVLEHLKDSYPEIFTPESDVEIVGEAAHII